HGVIHDPIRLGPDNTIKEAIAMMDRYHISGVPITDDSGKLVGILTNRDIRFVTEFSKPIRERMTKQNLITGKSGTTLDQAEKILQEHRIEKLPLIDEAGLL